MTRLWLMLWLLAAMPWPARAEVSDRETLRGASSVIIAVRLVTPGSLSESWRQQLEEQLTARLRARSIKVVSSQQLAPDQVLLQVTVSAVASPGQPYVYCAVSEEAVQIISLVRDPTLIRPATTWSANKILILREARASDQLVHTATGLADTFCQDFLSVNPTRP